MIRYILNLTIPGGDYSNKLVSLRLKTERQLSTRIDNVLPFFVFVPIFGRHTSFLKVFFYNLFPTITWLVEGWINFFLRKGQIGGLDFGNLVIGWSSLCWSFLSIGWVPAFTSPILFKGLEGVLHGWICRTALGDLFDFRFLDLIENYHPTIHRNISAKCAQQTRGLNARDIVWAWVPPMGPDVYIKRSILMHTLYVDFYFFSFFIKVR